jgi:RNA polymerase sigma-70 factor (ECF subfamily)
MAPGAERLVEDHLDALHGLAQAWTRDPELARELVQRTFLRAFEKLDQLREAQAARSWLISIFRNELAGERRAQARFEVWEAEAFEDLPAPGGEESPLDPEDLARLPGALADLPESSRRILLLRFQQELSYEAIGTLLGLPPGTVMSRLHRAKAMVRRLLRPNSIAGEGQA